jgi:hypothetical protein
VGRLLRLLFCLSALLLPVYAQVIEFESNNLNYQTLTKNGLTIMFASIPSHIKGYTVFQVAVSNGSTRQYSVDPEDFILRREDGSSLRAMPPRQVVKRMLEKANRDDVVKLVGTYEISLYGLKRMQSTNGYEQRRQTAIAELGGSKIKAAAAASAIAFVASKLPPGASTDGAVFYPLSEKPLQNARLVVRAAGELFEFNPVVIHTGSTHPTTP